MSDAEIIRAVGEIAGGAYAVQKLVGPTLDMLGNRARDLTDRGIANVGAVLRNAVTKVPDLEDEGVVPPRTLVTVWEEAMWADDDVMVEYLGGILASSRTSIARDDRGQIWARRVGGLSLYSIRLHYLLYEVARRALMGRDIKLSEEVQRHLQAGMFVAAFDLVECLDLGPDEPFESIMLHSIDSLQEERLLDDRFALAGPDALRKAMKGAWAPLRGLMYYPTPRGMELFLVAHGVRGRHAPSAFVDPDVDLALKADIKCLTGVAVEVLRKLPADAQDEFRRATWPGR